MARKLKTFVTSVGFFEEAVAAPSMKAAIELLGGGKDLFHKGFAKETDDPAIIAVAMEHPGIALKRPVGSKGTFQLHAKLPKELPVGGSVEKSPKKTSTAKQNRKSQSKDSQIDVRKTAEKYDREEKRREKERQRERAAQAKAAQRRDAAIAKAVKAFEAAEEMHNQSITELEVEQDAVTKKIEKAKASWETEQEKLEAAIEKARGL